MDIKQLIGDGSSFDALPEGIRDFISDLLSGGVRQYAIVAEVDNGSICSLMDVLNEEEHNVFTLLGAITAIQRDYMRLHIESYVEYERLEDDDV